MTCVSEDTLDRVTTRPDLTDRLLDLPPGQWWSPDGHLRMEVRRVGESAAPGSGRELPDGWVWVTGDLHEDGHAVDVCTVPVRLDALPAN
jgi:hypothetical protein